MAQARGILLASIVLGLSVGMNPAAAQKKYDPGATDSEIKIGNIMPYSGPLSAYALIGRTQDAFFKKLNAEGTTIIQVTHSETNAAYGNRIIQLRDGWIVDNNPGKSL